MLCELDAGECVAEGVGRRVERSAVLARIDRKAGAAVERIEVVVVVGIERSPHVDDQERAAPRCEVVGERGDERGSMLRPARGEEVGRLAGDEAVCFCADGPRVYGRITLGGLGTAVDGQDGNGVVDEQAASAGEVERDGFLLVEQGVGAARDIRPRRGHRAGRGRHAITASRAASVPGTVAASARWSWSKWVSSRAPVHSSMNVFLNSTAITHASLP